jgi:hypothetical protein
LPQRKNFGWLKTNFLTREPIITFLSVLKQKKFQKNFQIFFFKVFGLTSYKKTIQNDPTQGLVYKLDFFNPVVQQNNLLFVGFYYNFIAETY